MGFKKGNIPHNKGRTYSKEIRQKMYRNTIKQMQEIASLRGGKCFSNEYDGSSRNLKWRCEQGHEWEATPHNIKKNKWCPVCCTRIGERICKGYFEAFFEEKFPKAHPEWLKASKGKNLELDGFCKNLNLAFEYQGEQHYKPIPHFNRTFTLEKIRKHDELKKQGCIEKGVTLIQVPYHTNFIKLGKWIKDKCEKEGFKFDRTSKDFNYKTFDIYSPKKMEELQEIAEIKGGKCLSKKYINNSTKLKWQCKEGHIWETAPSNIRSGKWCLVCSVKKQTEFWSNQFGKAVDYKEKELENMQTIAEGKKGKCLSKEYVKNSIKLEFQCANGHIWKTKAENIKNGKWCYKCSYEYRASLRRGNIEDMQEIAESREGKCLSIKYFNVDTKLKWQCKEGHIWEAVPHSIKRGSWCAKCSNKYKGRYRRGNIGEMREIATIRGGECISKEYNGSGNRLKWKCKKSHEWEAVPDSIKRGSWCAKCARTKRQASSSLSL